MVINVFYSWWFAVLYRLTSKILFFGGYQVATENTLHRGIFSRRAAEITEAATLTLAAVPDGTYKR